MQTVAVVGTGAMGRGIIQWAVGSGSQILAYDQVSGSAEAARDFVGAMLGRRVDKGQLTSEERDAQMSRIHIIDDLTALSSADIVIEAVIEDVQVKRDLFQKFEAIIDPTALLCTNTSSLSVTEIAFGCEHPERVAGLHFFNPVPLMRVVEVIRAERTATFAIDKLLDLVKCTDHHPVLCTDSPGFVINNAGRGLNTEGLRIV
ncbi:MAG: hypothetical protein JKX85_00765, partial [Phycisphaeraceae bacterium]|nr:hypothetical protein [Phycisphaeraceae bacterium]